MKKVFFSFALLILFSSTAFAQEDENPIGELSKRLYENEMLANRFLKNFVLAKTQVFKSKIMSDFDKSLALFDDNIAYISMHIPDDNKIRDKFMSLQSQWNVYRMAIIDLEQKNYKKIVNSTLMMRTECTAMREELLSKHPKYDDNKKVFKFIDYVVENNKRIDEVVISYIFKNQLNFPEIDKAISIDFSAIEKNIGKLTKYKKLQDKRSLTDLSNSLKMIENIYNNQNDRPKLLYSNTKYFSKKSYLLFYELINQIQN